LFARISGQYGFVVLPWIALRGCAPLAQPDQEAAESLAARRLPASWLLVLVLPALTTSALYFAVRAGERPRWRAPYESAGNWREQGDLVLGMEASVGEYYLNPHATDLRHPVRVAWLDSWRAREPFLWAKHARRTWLILNPEQLYDWNPADAERMRRFL